MSAGRFAICSAGGGLNVPLTERSISAAAPEYERPIVANVEVQTSARTIELRAFARFGLQCVLARMMIPVVRWWDIQRVATLLEYIENKFVLPLIDCVFAHRLRLCAARRRGWSSYRTKYGGAQSCFDQKWIAISRECVNPRLWSQTDGLRHTIRGAASSRPNDLTSSSRRSKSGGSFSGLGGCVGLFQKISAYCLFNRRRRGNARACHDSSDVHNANPGHSI